MSWNDPSPNDAAEAYGYYYNRYCNAANERNALIRCENDYNLQKKANTTELNNCANEKINFEKRIDGISKIIKMLEGTGDVMTTNVPSAISKAITTIAKVDSNYKQSIKVTGGNTTSSLNDAFNIKTVEGDVYSAAALQEYKAEKVRLEQNIDDLNCRIVSLSDQISVLNSNINACKTGQSTYRRIMSNSAYEMNYYKKFMD